MGATKGEVKMSCVGGQGGHNQCGMPPVVLVFPYFSLSLGKSFSSI